MFAYCGNNPANFSDTIGSKMDCCTLVNDGGGWTERFLTADQAAASFSYNYYALSAFSRMEYATVIYSREIDGKTYYSYVAPRSGNPHDCTIPLNSVPDGATLVAYAHTHPNVSLFSDSDKQNAETYRIDAYMMGPDFVLQRYSPVSSSSKNICSVLPSRRKGISPFELCMLCVRWYAHFVDGECLKNPSCKVAAWPNEEWR